MHLDPMFVLTAVGVAVALGQLVVALVALRKRRA